jgi:hypothetical protein
MAWYLVFWRNRSTATVVPAASASQARSRAQRRHKKGYGVIVAARRANPQDSQLIRRGAWVRRRRDGTSPSSAVLDPRLGLGSSGVPTAPGCSSRLQAPAVGQPHGRPSLPAPSTSGAGAAAGEASAAGGRSPGCCRATGCMLRSQLSVEPTRSQWSQVEPIHRWQNWQQSNP